MNRDKVITLDCMQMAFLFSYYIKEKTLDVLTLQEWLEQAPEKSFWNDFEFRTNAIKEYLIYNARSENNV